MSRGLADVPLATVMDQSGKVKANGEGVGVGPVFSGSVDLSAEAKMRQENAFKEKGYLLDQIAVSPGKRCR